MLVPALVLFSCQLAYADTFLFDDVEPAGITLFFDAEIQTENGNPGGFLSITDAKLIQRGTAVFPLLPEDTMAAVSRINITADLRMGGGTDRPSPIRLDRLSKSLSPKDFGIAPARDRTTERSPTPPRPAPTVDTEAARPVPPPPQPPSQSENRHSAPEACDNA